MNTGARCAARPGLALLGFLVRRKERARVSALRFSWALIKERKRNNPPLRNRLGSVAAIGLVLARCARCSVVLGAVQCCALCSAGGGAGGGMYNVAHSSTMMCNDVRSVLIVYALHSPPHGSRRPRTPASRCAWLSPAGGLLPRPRGLAAATKDSVKCLTLLINCLCTSLTSAR